MIKSYVYPNMSVVLLYSKSSSKAFHVTLAANWQVSFDISDSMQDTAIFLPRDAL